MSLYLHAYAIVLIGLAINPLLTCGLGVMLGRAA